MNRGTDDERNQGTSEPSNLEPSNPRTLEPSNPGGSPDYCRALEAYLCQKNDGHLIRIVGPAFEQVAGWARDGIPLNVARAGIDRYFERYYRKGPRRRPVRIEFCDADVRDAFDDWRRAVGVSANSSEESDGAAEPVRPRRESLASHVERSLARLTMLRSSGRGASALQETIARLVGELDRLLGDARRARGEARDAIIAQLLALDRDLITSAMTALTEAERNEVARDARLELAPFSSRMSPDAYQEAERAAAQRLVRERLGLPRIAFD